MKNTIETFSALGARLLGFGDDDATRAVIDSACRANGWFTPADIRRAVRAIACDMLQREKLEAWLAEHFPDRAERVMGRVRETQGGRVYDPRFGKRMRGEGAHASLIARRFEVAMARLGLARELPPLRCDLFRLPRAQLSLF